MHHDKNNVFLLALKQNLCEEALSYFNNTNKEKAALKKKKEKKKKKKTPALIKRHKLDSLYIESNLYKRFLY